MTDTAPQPEEKRSPPAADLGRQEWLGFVLLVLLLIAGSALYLTVDYDAHWRASERRLNATTDVIVEFMQQAVNVVDLTLRSIDEDPVAANIVVSRSARELFPVLKSAQSVSTLLQGLGITDRRGKVIVSAASPIPSGADLSDRDYFQAHWSGAEHGLFFGRPVFARPQNVVTLPVSRGLQTPRGEFAGVIAARLEPHYFASFFAATGVDAVTVYRPDGITIAHFPEIDLVAAAILPPPNPVIDRAKAMARGVLLHSAAEDGVERLTAFRRLPAPALVIAVSLDAASIRADWLARTYPFFALLVAGLAFLSVVAYLVRKHERASARALAETAEARAVAEQLADVKGTFLANMSHEIRTPLGGILGYADLLLKSGLDRKQADWAVKLKSAGEQLLAVINDILDYSKLESGNFTIDPKPVATESLIDEVRSIMSPVAEGRGLKLSCEVEANLPKWLLTDPVRLRQILFNLVSNALKFTDSGSVSIKVTRSRLADQRAAIEIDVADTGIGIPPDKVASVFQRFTQADTKASRGRGGTGLGLSISRRLAELMGGELVLDSRLGAGTTVRLKLPLIAATPPAGDPSAATAAARPGHILLVDDLPMNIEIIGAMLKAQGHRVTAVSRGMDAIDRALAEDFDAILLDINLPDIDGYEVAREIRKLERPGRRIPILALTANALPEHIRQALDAGMDGHVSKPADERILAAKLAQVMAPAADAPAGPPETPQAPLIDGSTVATLERLLGVERVDGLKAGFWQKWHVFAEALADGRMPAAEIATEAHDMVSLAGNVGYMRLAQFSRDVSHAAKDDAPDLAALVARLLEVADATIRDEQAG